MDPSELSCGRIRKHDILGLLPDAENCGLHMRREYRERFSRHRLQKKSPVSDPEMHHGASVKHVPWCMSGSLTCGVGGNVPGIPGACATRKFTYLARGPWTSTRSWWYSPLKIVLFIIGVNPRMALNQPQSGHSSPIMVNYSAYTLTISQP